MDLVEAKWISFVLHGSLGGVVEMVTKYAGIRHSSGGRMPGWRDDAAVVGLEDSEVKAVVRKCA